MTQTFSGSRAQAAPRTTALLVYAVLFFGVLWLYSATLSGNLSVANDSSFYLLHVLNGAPQFSAHHLIYEPFAWVIYEAVRAVTGPMDVMSALKVVSLINSVFGAACATVILAIFHQRGRLPLAMSVLATLPAAVSFGLWYYSITVEVYVIGIFFLLVAFYILSADHISLTGWLIAGIAVGLGVLGHQIYPLFGAVILVRLMMIDDGWAARLTAAWTCIGPAILTALIPYVLVVLFTDTVKDGELMHWLMGYAATDREFVQTASGSTVSSRSASIVAASRQAL